MGSRRHVGRRGSRRRILLATLGMVAACSALADDEDVSGLPIVLTASRVRQSVAEAPAAVTVIDREMIRQSGVRQIADLLRFVPGAVVGYNDGNWPAATLRGMSGAFASGLQVLIDGVSVYSPVFGGMLWAELPISLDDIDHIEIVRGPNGASYGANSFQGVVNIITRDPAADDRLRATATVGGDGIRDGTLRVADNHAAWRYRATLGQRFDEGFAEREDAMQLTFGNLRADYQVDPQNSVSAALRFADKRKQIEEFTRLPASHQTGDKLDMQLRWSHANSTDDEWWVQFYHQKFSQRDRLFIADFRPALDPAVAALIPFPLPLELEQDYATWRDGLELQSNRRWTQRLRTVAGAEVRRDAALSGRLFATNDEQTTFLTRVFGSVEWIFAPAWILNAGALYERNSFASNGWSPRIALIHELMPGHNLRVSYSAARRTPALYEEKANYGLALPLPAPFNFFPIITGSGRADSERVHAADVGYVFSLPEVALNGDVRWFTERYTGLISFRGQNLNSPPFTGGDAVNLDAADVDGYEMTLNWRPAPRTYVRFAASIANTASTDIGTSYTNSVPRSTIALLVSQGFADGWSAAANYQRVSEMRWTDAGSGRLTIPPIDHLNLRLGKTFTAGAYEIEVAGVLQNALGHYRDYYLGPPASSRENIARRVAFLQVSARY